MNEISTRENLAVGPSPKVEYGQELAGPEVPYQVNVDGQAFGRLMGEFGMADDQIRGMTIKVVKGYKDKAKGGIFNPRTNTISLAIDPVWEMYEKGVETAKKIQRGEKRPKKRAFRKLLTTQRMADYLTEAPPERGLKTAKRELARGMSKKAGSSGLHESKHALDKSGSRREAYAMIDGLVSTAAAGMGFYSPAIVKMIAFELFNRYPSPTPLVNAVVSGLCLWYIAKLKSPTELRAEAFAKKLKHNPKWSSLVTIQPKEEAEANSS
jgi:hypothetical protein